MLCGAGGTERKENAAREKRNVLCRLPFRSISILALSHLLLVFFPCNLDRILFFLLSLLSSFCIQSKTVLIMNLSVSFGCKQKGHNALCLNVNIGSCFGGFFVSFPLLNMSCWLSIFEVCSLSHFVIEVYSTTALFAGLPFWRRRKFCSFPQ